MEDGPGDNGPQLLVGLATPFQPPPVNDQYVDLPGPDSLLARGQRVVVVYPAFALTALLCDWVARGNPVGTDPVKPTRWAGPARDTRHPADRPPAPS
jgi:hypothetical protein